MIELINGNALNIPLADKSVQCVITSPSYFGLRNYGVEGQIGLEKSPEEYVAKLVEVFREVKRVLRKDGVVFLNLGDSYNGSGKARGNGGIGPKSAKQLSNRGAYFENENPVNYFGFKPKDRMGIPHRVVFALQADGWWWRDEIVWHKPNPMPSSVIDRTTCAHEFVFMLSKSARYFYDATAIAEPSVDPESYTGRRKRNSGQMDSVDPQNYKFHGSVQEDGTLRYGQTYPTRNRRSVWTITPEQFHGAHFASFPQDLVEPMILAGTSPQACERCGAPWKRRLEKKANGKIHPANDISGVGHGYDSIDGKEQNRSEWQEGVYYVTVGWQPTCHCPNIGAGKCIVLDPFAGSGTVGRVCIKHKRSFVGLELKPEYIDLARERTSNAPVMLMEIA